MPASNPNPSQITCAVDRGKIEAANNDAFSNPNANSVPAHFPANGTSAAAACAASVIPRCPDVYSVAAVQTMMKNTIAMQLMLPMATSARACGYCRTDTFFSTKLACMEKNCHGAVVVPLSPV